MTFPVCNLPRLINLSKKCNFSFFLPTTIYLLRHAYYSFTFKRGNPPLLIHSLLQNIISGLCDGFLALISKHLPWLGNWYTTMHLDMIYL